MQAFIHPTQILYSGSSPETGVAPVHDHSTLVLQIFPIKDQKVNIFHLEGHSVTASTTQLCPKSRKAHLDDTLNR